MEPELHDPERATPPDAPTAVSRKAEEVEELLKRAADGLRTLQVLMAEVPDSELPAGFSAQVADLRVSLIEQAQSMEKILLLPMIIKVVYRRKEGSS